MPATTFPPGLIYQQAQQFQDELESANQGAVDAMLSAWAQMYANVRADYDTLLAKVQAARDEGRDVSPAWLYQQQRLKSALATTKAEVARYARDASDEAYRAHDAAVRAALKAAKRQVTTAKADAGIEGTFTALDEAPVRALVGFLADGSPLSSLFDQFGQDAADQARAVLLRGIGQGKGVAWMARRLDEALDVPRWRAETIVRTESHRVFREVSRRTYQANADALEGWIWTAHLDRRTCPACVVMDGTLHPLDETLDGHPRCRCAMVPRTKSWADLLGIDAEDEREPVRQGREWLEAQPAAVQRQVLGGAKYRAWKSGDITLDDVVARTHSADWGTMRRERSMREIRQGRNANTTPEPAPAPIPEPTPEPEPPRPPRPLSDEEQEWIDAIERTEREQEERRRRLADPEASDVAKIRARGELEYFEQHLATMRERLVEAGVKAEARLAALESTPGIAALPRKPELAAGALEDQVSALAADVIATNPGYDSGDRNYRVNCVHVANAYELRRRGYDVTATPLPPEFKGRGRSSWEALDRWVTPGGGSRRLQHRTPRQVEREVMSWPVGARGWITVGWKGRGAGGHIFNVERTEAGVHYVEAQSGKSDLDIAHYWRLARAGSVLLSRVDDLIPTDAVLEFVVPKKG